MKLYHLSATATSINIHLSNVISTFVDKAWCPCCDCCLHVMITWTMIAETGLNNAFRSTCTLYSGRSIPQYHITLQFHIHIHVMGGRWWPSIDLTSWKQRNWTQLRWKSMFHQKQTFKSVRKAYQLMYFSYCYYLQGRGKLCLYWIVQRGWMSQRWHWLPWRQ